MRRNLKQTLLSAFSVLTLVTLCACGATSNGEVQGDDAALPVMEEQPEAEAQEQAEEPGTWSNELPAIPEGTYRSELTGEPIDLSLQNQRPMAIMVDNEKMALDHYGTAKADVVYEMMNSTANNRITRLMVLIKDWEQIEQLGSIRSTRPTNLLLLGEWNAILCHDGGPQVHNEAYYAKPYVDRFSGTFHRIQNGKPKEFTEYVVKGDIEANFSSHSGISREYNEYAPKRETHFKFADYGLEVNLNETYDNAFACTQVILPFPHNESKLIYNPETQMYEYYEYGARHEDAEDGAVMAFKNVFLQNCTFTQLDSNGYLIYNVIDNARLGLYFTNGYCKGVTWVKSGETEITHFYDEFGDEIEINEGKTYIGLIPDDSWEEVELH